ncbi:hypothetical protein FRX31_013120 [Thalictrum thalictroides]|uniref:Uncharacterized protein n=1 Tax=Thalictrum thalictroides TaxID=46969 RepID=A0A7J6WK23_THATH|nr:hypothetical protein FRX31_013120 [Thalictrum thalictroides]
MLLSLRKEALMLRRSCSARNVTDYWNCYWQVCSDLRGELKRVADAWQTGAEVATVLFSRAVCAAAE